jgi:hypothetical protein
VEDISIWLIPSKDEENQISKEVIRLATKYNSFPFIPHLTAYYLAKSFELKQVLPIVRQVAASVSKFDLYFQELSHDNIFSKTLYAKYTASQELDAIYTLFKNEFYSKYPYNLNPHMSLLYKNSMDINAKNSEIFSIVIPNKITIDSIAVITKPGGAISTEKDVLEWRVRYQEELLKKK